MANCALLVASDYSGKGFLGFSYETLVLLTTPPLGEEVRKIHACKKYSRTTAKHVSKIISEIRKSVAAFEVIYYDIPEWEQFVDENYVNNITLTQL